MKKNKFLFLGMLALALTFTLVLAGCPGPDTPPKDPTPAELATKLAATLNGFTADSAEAVEATVTLKAAVSVDSEATLSVPSGVTLATGAYVLTVEGTLAVAGAVTVPNGGTIDLTDGSLAGSTGTITVNSGGEWITPKTGPQLFGSSTGSVVLNKGATSGDWLGTTVPTGGSTDPRIALTVDGSKVTINKDGFKIEGTAVVTRIRLYAETMTIAGTVTLQANNADNYAIRVNDAGAKIKLVSGGSLKGTTNGILIYRYDMPSTPANFTTTSFEGLKADGTYGASDTLSVTDQHSTLTWSGSAWTASAE
jgi:hypothetical protein